MIAETGEKLLVDIYNGNDGDTLDKFRLVKYHEKVSTGSKQVQPKVLPPTSVAAKYHSYRVFYQVQEWACLHGYQSGTHARGMGVSASGGTATSCSH